MPRRFLLTLFVAVLALAPAWLARAQPVSVRVNVARAAAYADPAETSLLLDYVPYGTVLALKAVEGDWFRVYLPPDPRLLNARAEVCVSRASAVMVTDSPAGSASPAQPAPSSARVAKSGISMAVDVAGKTDWLTPALARVVPVIDRVDSLAALAASPTLEAALAGATPMPGDPSASVTWVWTLGSDRDPPVVSGRRPTFVAIFDRVPGLRADEFVPAIVKLTPAGPNAAVLATARGRADAPNREQADWMLARDLKQITVKVEFRPTAAGMIKVSMPAALAPGGYALVLRPMYLKGYSGRRALNGDAEGVAFALAWPFVIR